MGMDDMFARAIRSMDEEQARNILDRIGEDDLAQSIDWVFENAIVPHLVDIRERSRGGSDSSEVRQRLSDMSQEQQEAIFYDTLRELVVALVKIRNVPVEGFADLKTMLRDPVTTEVLLLIFENEDHIDESYSDQMKEFGAEHIRWVGAMVLPEMYEEHEVEEVLDALELGADVPTDV